IAIKSFLTLISALVWVIIIVGALFCGLSEGRKARWLLAGAGAISLVITAAGVAGGWYVFWINPTARIGYEVVVLGDSVLAEELVSGLLDDEYVENQSNSGYLEYRTGQWRGTFYSSRGYRRGAPVYIYLDHYPGFGWFVNASGYSPVPVDSVEDLNIALNQIRPLPNGTFEVENDDGECVPLSTVNDYLANDPKASDSLRGMLKEDVDFSIVFSIDNGAPGVNYLIFDNRFDVLAERERLSRLLDLIAGFYPADYDYDWDPAEFGDYTWNE
ncbi:MAG: hypothetical protein JSW52_05185, partial [Candidatus Coatesbacteria bacterium]